jgi:hypothetical protein
MNNISFSLFDDALSYLLAIICKYLDIIKHLMFNYLNGFILIV